MSVSTMAERIKHLRRSQGLTLEQVATVVGVGKSTVRKWETGMIANMKRDKIAALAKALDTTPAFLMGWDEEPPDPVLDDALVDLLCELTPEEVIKVTAYIEGLIANRS